MNRTQISEAYNVDCMEYMKGIPDGYFHLAVCDPPYGIGEDGKKNHSRGKGFGGGLKSPVLKAASKWAVKSWDKEPPPVEYFDELIRVSKNQIIWGANHFISRLPYDSPCWLVWDKMNGESDFADCELAWTSFKTAVRKYEIRWNGLMQHDMANKEVRIQPCQKPVRLYKEVLQDYARPGQRILDTHLGSGSSRIAAYDMGLDFYATELDPDYFAAMEARFKAHIAKPQLFAPEQQYTFKQAELFTSETLEK